MTTTGPARALLAAEMRNQRGRLALAAGAGVAVSVAAVALLGLSGWFIASAAFAGIAGAATAHAFNYLLPSAVIRLLAIVRTGARYVERVAGHEAALKGLARLRPQLFRAFVARPADVLRVSSGEASSRLVQDVDALQTWFVRRSALWSLAAGAAGAAVMASLSTPLAGAVVLGGMTLTVAGGLVIERRRARPAGAAVQAAEGAFRSRLAAIEAAAPDIRAYGLSEAAQARLAAPAAAVDDARQRLAEASGLLLVWQALCMGATVAGAAGVAAAGPVPLLTLAVLAAAAGIETATGVLAALRDRGAGREAVRRLDELAAAAPERANALPLNAEIVLFGANVVVAPPARLALIGPSGSGKTTLVERLIGLRRPLVSEILLGRRDLAAVDPHAARALFSYLEQDVRLLDASVRDNLRLAGPAATDGAMWEALEAVGLAERFARTARGLDEQVGANGRRLSGGERRRLALARALLRPARWLILDEPTEGLDAETEARVLRAIERRLEERGQGLILISHRPAPAMICDSVVAVEGCSQQGRVRLSGIGRNLAAA